MPTTRTPISISRACSPRWGGPRAQRCTGAATSNWTWAARGPRSRPPTWRQPPRPRARVRTFRDGAGAREYCRDMGAPLVVNADGLGAGKGVIVCRSLEEADQALARCFDERAFGDSGLTVVVEEFLEGEEASFFALADGAAVLPLVAAQDHKTVFDDDRGPNTGGMGAYSPAPVMGSAMEDRVMAEIVRPVIAAMAKEGAAYTGVLFVGLMITREGPQGIEFNCRFREPEWQAIMPD